MDSLRSFPAAFGIRRNIRLRQSAAPDRIRQTIFRPPSHRICVDDAKKGARTRSFVDRVMQRHRWSTSGNLRSFETTCVCSARPCLTLMHDDPCQRAHARYVQSVAYGNEARHGTTTKRHRQKKSVGSGKKESEHTRWGVWGEWRVASGESAICTGPRIGGGGSQGAESFRHAPIIQLK